MEIGISLAFILTLIGLMNYVNTSVGSIQSRQMEFSVLESVGMTDQQIDQMLIREGILYAIGVWSLTMTVGVGVGVTYGLYQSVNYNHAAFWIPLFPLLAAMLLTLLIYISVSLAVWRRTAEEYSVVERIKGMEG